MVLSWPACLLSSILPYTQFAWVTLALSTVIVAVRVVVRCAFQLSAVKRLAWLIVALSAALAAAGQLVAFDLPRRHQDVTYLWARQKEAQQLLQAYSDLPRFCFLVALINRQLLDTLWQAVHAL